MTWWNFSWTLFYVISSDKMNEIKIIPCVLYHEIIWIFVRNDIMVISYFRKKMRISHIYISGSPYKQGSRSWCQFGCLFWKRRSDDFFERWCQENWLCSCGWRERKRFCWVGWIYRRVQPQWQYWRFFQVSLIFLSSSINFEI